MTNNNSNMSAMMKKLLLPFLLLFSFAANAQLNNSWIDYSKTYYKFKIANDNVYRIPKTALDAAGIAATTNADYFQIWKNGVQVRLYTSVSAIPLGASDYIEFWGQRNDGKADKPLYKKPEFQLADKYSLETDTAAYFLTVNPAGGNLRFASAGNTAPSAATPDAYFMRKVDIYYNGQWNAGFGKNYGEYVYSAAYDDGEGYTSTEIASPKNFSGVVPGNYTETQSGLNLYTAGPANSLSVRAKVYFNTDIASRTLSVKIANNEIFAGGPYFDPQSVAIDVPNLPLSYFDNPAALTIKFSNTNVSPSYPPTTPPDPPAPVTPTDRMVIATWGITYPATFNFNNLRAFNFELPAAPAGNYLVIDNFNYGTVAPVLYDYTTGRRYVGEIASTPGKVKFVLPPSAEPVREFRLVNEEAANTSNVTAFTARTFVDYNTAATRGDYIIISNPKLYNDGSGNNYVDQYRQYRSSADGGSFNAKVYDVNELTDQFGFGIKNHPSAIRDFAMFIDQQYTVKPKFYLLIGRGLTNYDAKLNESNPISSQLDLVHTFGWPASDNLLVSPPGVVRPLAPVGRIAAINGTEVGNYLQKLKQYEAEQKRQSPLIGEKQWMKNAMQIVGGKTEDESALFRFYMDNYKATLQDSLFGGKVETFTKTSVAAVQQASSDRITQLFQEGLGIIGYFGHSSANVFEFNLSNPLSYNNTGKYPFFNVSGCSAGNFYTFDPTRLTDNLSLSERYILSNQKGSIGFLADTHFGLPDRLDVYNTEFYSLFCKTMYGQRVGDQLKSVISTIGGDDPDLFYTTRWHLEEINLHGDPALRINSFAKPDYAIEDQSIKITPDIISIAEPNFHIKVMLRNIGKASNDSIKVYIKRLLPNNTTVTLLDSMLLAPKNIDSLELTVGINSITDKGQNQLIVELDYTNRVSELYETNNKITKPFYVFEDELRPVYPYKYAIVNTSPVIFSASTANPLAAPGNFTMELDTTQLFNSPFKKTYTVTSPAGLIQFTPTNITYKDSTVYYWRTGVIAANGNTIWNGSSFTYLPNSTPGFDQSHYYQHLASSLTDMTLGADRILKFNPKTAQYVIKTGTYPYTTETDEWSISNDGFLEQSGFIRPFQNNYNVLRFFIIDSITLKPWLNLRVGNPITGLYGSFDPLRWNNTMQQGVFHFDISTPAARLVVKQFIDMIPQGNVIAIVNSPVLGTTSFPASWTADPAPNMYQSITALGIDQISQVTQDVPFVFVARKGAGVAMSQTIAANVADKLSINFGVDGRKSSGSMLSDVLGPAKKWNALHWRDFGLEPAPNDYASVQIVGLNISGTQDVLATVSPARDTSLTWIDAATYPSLKLNMLNTDTITGTPDQLRYWRINADMLPEGAVAPNISYSMKDTVITGEPIDFKLAFKNVGNVKFDSLMTINLKITTASNYDSIINIPRGRMLQVSPDTIMVRYTIPSENYVGSNLLSVEFNPNNSQPEQYHFNNFLLKPFYVVGDKFNPLLDVTFDGIHILNNDIVSSKPNILIKLKDENRFLALKDTALMLVQLRYPDGNLRTMNFNGDTMRFIPANTAAGENAASIELKPYLPLDGEYELIVSGRDVSGNPAGTDMSYHSSFNVINKPMISELLNYPNPFTTSTAFVFTLTGSDIPQNMRIQILTITGKVVREITKNELGPIHIGRNITEFKWDGTDMYGQKLANGVYIYRVLTNLNGKSLDKYKADGDNTSKYFNKGYGKMYLMR
jgi:hypothetical protein